MLKLIYIEHAGRSFQLSYKQSAKQGGGAVEVQLLRPVPPNLNNYTYDILGASKVGMKTAHLARDADSDTAADIVFNDYRTLEHLLLDAVRS